MGEVVVEGESLEASCSIVVVLAFLCELEDVFLELGVDVGEGMRVGKVLGYYFSIWEGEVNFEKLFSEVVVFCGGKVFSGLEVGSCLVSSDHLQLLSIEGLFVGSRDVAEHG